MAVAALIVYLGAVFYFNYRMRRRIRSQGDYFVAGQNVGLLAATLSFGSVYMAYVMAGAQTSFYFGISGVWYAALFALSAVLIALGVAGPIRKMGLFTLPEYLYRRYSLPVSLLGGLFVVVQIVLVSPLAALSAMGGIVQALFHLPLQTGIILAAAICFIYLYMSGWYAVAYTNSIHLLVGMLALVCVVVFGWRACGGSGGLLSNASSATWDLTAIGTFNILTMALTYCLNVFTGAVAFQSIAATAGPREAKLSVLIGGPVIGTIAAILGALLGIEASFLYPNTPALTAIARTMVDISPIWGPLVAVGMLVSLLPSVSQTIMTANTIISRDIYARLRPNLNDWQVIRASRGFLFLLIGLACCCAIFWHEELMKLGLFAFAMRNVPLLPLMLGGFLWPRGHKQAALAAEVCGVATVIIWFAFAFPWGIHPLYPGLIVSITVYTLWSLTRNADAVDPYLLFRVKGGG